MTQFIFFFTTVFWLLMIYDCVRNDPQKNQWLYLLIFLNFPGAVIYFLVRRLPQIDLPLPRYFARWTQRRELWMAEADARNIGKAHQYAVLGNLLCDMGIFDRAEVAYNTALEKEPKNIQALWGAAFIDMQNKKFTNAKEHLENLLKLEPEYKYGEASLAYGKVLVELQEKEAAKIHLQKHIKQWGHPEAYIMLATILSEEGDRSSACGHLETMIARVRGSSYYHYKRNRHWVTKGKKLLKILAKG